MQRAVAQGRDAPPVDLRYLKRPSKNFTTPGTASVVSFLSEIYESIAETLPDFRDETLDIETSLQEVIQAEPDGYAQLLTDKSELEAKGKEACKKEGGKRKLRVMNKSVRVNTSRKAEQGGLRENKFLPPGQMKDYWEMYKMRNSESLVKCASFTTFWRVLGLILHSCFFVLVCQES